MILFVNKNNTNKDTVIICDYGRGIKSCRSLFLFIYFVFFLYIFCSVENYTFFIVNEMFLTQMKFEF